MGYSTDDPYSDSITNPNRDDYWTCPVCISDLGNIGEGIHTCSSCGAIIECSIIHQPACKADLVEQEEE